MNCSISCRVLRSHADLADFVPQWQALLRADSQSTPFQSPEWLLPWSETFAKPDSLRCVAVLSEQEYVAFLPFYLLDETPSGECQLHLLGVGTSDYLDGLFAPSCVTEHLRAALLTILESPEWTSLHVSQLRPGSPLLETLSRLVTAASDPRLHDSTLCRYASEPCSSMAAVMLSSLPPKLRRNAMYYRNAAARRGSLTLNSATTETAPHLFQKLVELHTARWQNTGEPGVLADDRVLAWHRRSVPLLAAAGLLRLTVLELDKQVIGILYSLVDVPSHGSRTQYIYLTAYDIAFHELRPGTLLLALTIDAASQEGIVHIDMLRGQESYKQLWHVEQAPTVGLTLPRSAFAALPAAKQATISP